MQLKESIIIIAMLVWASSVQAQHKNALQVGMGFTHTGFIDQQASPLLYHHNGINLNIDYVHYTNNGIIIGGLQGGLGRLMPAGMDDRYWYTADNNEGVISDSMELTGTFYHAQFKAGYLDKIADAEKGKTFIGGSVSNTVYYSDNIIRAGWFNATAGNIELQQQITPAEKHLIQCAITIPLLARITRLPYHNSISAPGGESNVHTLFSGSKLGWPGNYLQLGLKMQYQYAISNGISIGAAYNATWMHYQYELPIRLLQHNGTGYIQFQF